MKKVITRIRGGLGNQMFCYAAARRLALANDAELIIDDVTGFSRDRKYRRQYALDHFHIPARKATPAERLEPFERYRRGALKWLSRRKEFSKRRYLEQEGLAFDDRLLTLTVADALYLDGLWQSENYFKDVEKTIRKDFRILPPSDSLNQRMADDIRSSNAVALHVRWFDAPGRAGPHNVGADYYRRAVSLMEDKIASPHYFVFSNDQRAAKAELTLPDDQVTFVSHNRGDQNGYADLWLMTQCKHFITANSTFSWWGAWLAQWKDKVVVSPKLRIDGGGLTAWNFSGQIPNEWIVV